MRNESARHKWLVVLAVCAFVGGLAAAAMADSGAFSSVPAPASWTGDFSRIKAGDWNYDRAGHLLERAGFGGAPDEIKRLAAMTPREAVGYLVDYESLDNSGLEPFDESGIFPDGKNPYTEGMRQYLIAAKITDSSGKPIDLRRGQDSNAETEEILRQVRNNYRRANSEELNRVALWWVDRMLTTNRPLEEKMTLFWHGHFPSSGQKIRDYRMLMAQQELFRENATGNFKDLLMGIAKDPAMLIYLDGRQNIKGRPNENFAREIMELFSLGVGNYSEEDIKEAARAFTGWRYNGLEFAKMRNLHDYGSKTFLGETGRLDGEDIIDIIMEQEATAEFIARKIHVFFVREDPSDETVEKLAHVFRSGNYEIKPLLKAIFLSKDFYSAPSYATQIKSPVQLVVSTYRKLGLEEIPSWPPMKPTTSNMGQDLFYPPNVAGWDGGKTWINPSTLLLRANFTNDLLFGQQRMIIARQRYDAGQSEGRGDSRPRYDAMEMDRPRGRDMSREHTGEYSQREWDELFGILFRLEREAMFRRLREANGRGVELTPEQRERVRQAFQARGGFGRRPGSGSEGEMEMDRHPPQRPAQTDRARRPDVNRISAPPIKRDPPRPAQIDLAEMIEDESIRTADEAVDYFMARFLRMPLDAGERQEVIDFLEEQNGGSQLAARRGGLEQALRQTLHLILSAPAYQLG